MDAMETSAGGNDKDWNVLLCIQLAGAFVALTDCRWRQKCQTLGLDMYLQITPMSMKNAFWAFYHLESLKQGRKGTCKLREGAPPTFSASFTFFFAQFYRCSKTVDCVIVLGARTQTPGSTLVILHIDCNYAMVRCR